MPKPVPETPMTVPVTPAKRESARQPPKDTIPDEAPNRTGDGEWQPGGDPRHSGKH